MPEYIVGSQVWHCASRSKAAWRVGIVTKVAPSYHGGSGLVIAQPGKPKTSIHVSSYELSYGVMPREAIHNAPNGTIYITDTKIGWSLSMRIPQPGPYPNALFSVLECGTRMQTLGNLLGYIIIPCRLDSVVDYYKNYFYKSWLIGPSVPELLSFLNEKLPEVIHTHHVLTTKEKPNDAEPSTKQSEDQVQEVDS